jgi:hypothetical protein
LIFSSIKEARISDVVSELMVIFIIFVNSSLSLNIFYIEFNILAVLPPDLTPFHKTDVLA